MSVCVSACPFYGRLDKPCVTTTFLYTWSSQDKHICKNIGEIIYSTLRKSNFRITKLFPRNPAGQILQDKMWFLPRFNFFCNKPLEKIINIVKLSFVWFKWTLFLIWVMRGPLTWQSIAAVKWRNIHLAVNNLA